jgi:hypothetical protein
MALAKEVSEALTVRLSLAWAPPNSASAKGVNLLTGTDARAPTMTVNRRESTPTWPAEHGTTGPQSEKFAEPYVWLTSATIPMNGRNFPSSDACHPLKFAVRLGGCSSNDCEAMY